MGLGLQGPGRWCGPGTRPRLEIPEGRNAYSAPSQPPAAPPRGTGRGGCVQGGGAQRWGACTGCGGHRVGRAALGCAGLGSCREGPRRAAGSGSVPPRRGALASFPAPRAGSHAPHPAPPRSAARRPVGLVPAAAKPRLASPSPPARPPAPQPGLQGRWKVDAGAGIEGAERGTALAPRGGGGAADRGPREFGTRGCP